MAKDNKDKKQENDAASGSPNDQTQNTGTDAPEKDDSDATVGPAIVRKLTPKDVMEVKINKLPVPSDLYTIIGRANNLRDGESDYGPWTSLRGEFEAVRLHDGKTFIAAECFIPGAAGDLLVNQVRSFIQETIEVTPKQMKKSGRTYRVSGEYVELALIVTIKESAREGGVAYEFVTRPIVSVQKADPLASLREKLQKALPKMLAAPKPAAPPVAMGTSTQK